MFAVPIFCSIFLVLIILLECEGSPICGRTKRCSDWLNSCDRHQILPRATNHQERLPAGRLEEAIAVSMVQSECLPPERHLCTILTVGLACRLLFSSSTRLWHLGTSASRICRGQHIEHLPQSVYHGPAAESQCLRLHDPGRPSAGRLPHLRFAEGKSLVRNLYAHLSHKYHRTLPWPGSTGIASHGGTLKKASADRANAEPVAPFQSSPVCPSSRRSP